MDRQTNRCTMTQTDRNSPSIIKVCHRDMKSEIIKKGSSATYNF